MIGREYRVDIFYYEIRIFEIHKGSYVDDYGNTNQESVFDLFTMNEKCKKIVDKYTYPQILKCFRSSMGIKNDACKDQDQLADNRFYSVSDMVSDKTDRYEEKDKKVTVKYHFDVSTTFFRSFISSSVRTFSPLELQWKMES